MQFIPTHHVPSGPAAARATYDRMRTSSSSLLATPTVLPACPPSCLLTSLHSQGKLSLSLKRWSFPIEITLMATYLWPIKGDGGYKMGC